MMRTPHPGRAVAGTIMMVMLAAAATAQEKKPMPLKDIRYESSADHTQQPARFWAPETDAPAPLLVVLHTWSGDYRQDFHPKCVEYAMTHNWVVILPNFRGPNNKPEACGSELVVADVLSAVDYAKRTAKVDEKRVYLVGSSGGGYAALLMAGRSPETWTAVSAWVPIVDLKAWYAECRERKLNYANNVVKCCGGVPGASAAVDEEYRKRSAITWLANAKDAVPLDINAGIHDGHGGSVPVSHALRGFNAVADEGDRISDADIAFMTDKAKVPPHLVKKIDDSTYGRSVPLFRRESLKARVSLFEGGHEIVQPAAMAWLEKHVKD